VLGAATSDDVSVTIGGTIGGQTRYGLCAGWWCPTTLTATRKLWGAALIHGVEIDTTTSELRVRSDNTTDGQWTTSGVGLAVDKWTFVAYVNNYDTGTTLAHRLWSGEIGSPPVSRTLTQAVAPSGAPTGSTNLAVGNAGSAGTLAFQGHADSFYWIASRQNGNATTHPLYFTAAATITAACEALLYERIIYPMWAGTYFPLPSPGAYGSSTTSGEFGGLSLDTLDPAKRFMHTGAAALSPYVVTAWSGATVSARRGPRASISLLPNVAALSRRRGR